MDFIVFKGVAFNEEVCVCVCDKTFVLLPSLYFETLPRHKFECYKQDGFLECAVSCEGLHE